MQVNYVRSVIMTALLVAVLMTTSSTVRAGQIVLTTGNITQIAPPLSVANNALTSTTTISVFRERRVQGATISFDFAPPSGTGPVINVPGPVPGILSTTNLIDSHLIHWDRPGSPQPGASLTGNILFNQPILAVIFTDARLDGTDVLLGAPTTSYGTGTQFRGTIGAPQGPGTIGASEGLDFIFLASSGAINGYDTISVTMDVAAAFDEVRVITAAIPEPSTVASVVIGLSAIGCFVILRHVRNKGRVALVQIR